MVYSHKEAAVNAARYIEGIQAAYGSMPYLPVQNMGCKKMPVANSSLYKKVNQQKQAASQPAPTPVAQSHPQPPSSGTYALAAAGDRSHAATYVPPVAVSVTQSSLAATSPPADIALKLEAWKQAQEEKYEQRFAEYREQSKAAAAAAEEKRGAELALIKQENYVRSQEMEALRSSMDSFQGRLMTEFSKTLDNRMQASEKSQAKLGEQLRESQQLNATRLEAMEINMKLIMEKLLGPAEDIGATSSPDTSPAPKKARAVTIPVCSLGPAADATRGRERDGASGKKAARKNASCAAEAAAKRGGL